MLISVPILLNSRKNSLDLPQLPKVVSPNVAKTDIIMAHLSALQATMQDCQKELLKLYHLFGEMWQKSDTITISINLPLFCQGEHKNAGVGYSSINSARSTLSSMIISPSEGWCW